MLYLLKVYQEVVNISTISIIALKAKLFLQQYRRDVLSELFW